MINQTFIIAEAGVNHNGRLDLALKLIEAAHQAGADAVKFQTFRTEKVITRAAPMADYQKKNIGNEGSQFDMLRQLELSYAEFVILHAYCKEIGIQFLSTPDEEESLDFLANKLDLPWLKVGSGEINNFSFLRRIASKNRTVILSTGMSTLGEVEKALNVLQDGGAAEVVLLHCTTNYPCPLAEVNLRAMLTLREAFKVRVGYSDHTLGWTVPVAAVAMGAEIIEKHFTLDSSMDGPDHKASLDPIQLKEMVTAIRGIESAMGDGIKRPNSSEERLKPLIRRVIVGSRDIPKGIKLSQGDLLLKRNSQGLGAEYLDILLGKQLKKPLNTDEPLTMEHFL